MLKKIASISLLLLVAVAVMFAAAPDKMKAKKPFAVNPDNEISAVAPRVTPSGIASAYTLGPGDSIGYTWYDYGTNGTPNHSIVHYGNGVVSVGVMASATKGNADRGTYFTYRPSATGAFTAFKRVETARRGWGNIDQFAQAGGVEVVVSHVGPIVNVDAAKGAGTWTQTVYSTCKGVNWPKIAGGNATTFHVVIPNAAPDTLFYDRSDDAGATFAVKDKPIFLGKAGLSADNYDIACSGTKVAIVMAGTGDDVYLALSTDNGATFTESKIYDVKSDSNSIGATESQQQPDGSCSVAFDKNANVHVVWGSYQARRGSDNWPALYYSVNAAIWHYSVATGAHPVVYPLNKDTMILKGVENMPGVDGSLCTMPSLGFDATKMYLVYAGQTKEMSVDTLPYVHVYAVYSTDAGAHWFGPTDLTPVTKSDNTFPFLAKNVDANLHIVYNTDAWPGNFLQGTTNHPDTTTVIKYLKTPVSGLSSTPIVSVRENGTTIPGEYALNQNYPNPFNPTTQITFSIPNNELVSLRIYNMLGQEIATLVNEVKTAGSYTVDFDASNLTSGVYFYQLNAGSFSSTKRMMFVK